MSYDDFNDEEKFNALRSDLELFFREKVISFKLKGKNLLSLANYEVSHMVRKRLKSYDFNEQARKAKRALKCLQLICGRKKPLIVASHLLEYQICKQQGWQTEAEMSVIHARKQHRKLPGEISSKLTENLVSSLIKIGAYEAAESIVTNLQASQSSKITTEIKNHLNQAKKYNKRGMQAYEKGEVDAAILLFLQGLTHYPGLTYLIVNLLQTLLEDCGKRPSKKSDNLLLCKKIMTDYEKNSSIEQLEKKIRYERFHKLKEKYLNLISQELAQQ